MLSDQLHSSFFSYWQNQTKIANQMFREKHYDDALYIYLDLYLVCKHLTQSLKGQDWSGLSNEESIQIIECYCITTDNISEIHANRNQGVTQILNTINLINDLIDIFFYQAPPKEIKFPLKSIIQRSYLNYQTLTQDIHPRVLKRIEQKVSFKPQFVQHLLQRV